VALGWHAIEFVQTSTIVEFYIWFRFRPYHRSRHVILHQSSKFYPNRTTLGRKKWRHVDFQDGGSQPSWILAVQLAIMGSLKSPCTTSYRSSRDHNSKLLSFWENRVFCILATDKQTDRRTDGQHRCTTPLSRGGLIIIIIIIIGKFIERLWKKATEAYNNFIDSKYISTATNSYGCS